MIQPYTPTADWQGRLRRVSARVFARHLIKVQLPRAIISFAFDDFPASAAETAATALEARGWKGTFYASCGLMGQENHLGQLFEGHHLARLESRGHEIGCHTFSHDDASLRHATEVVADVDRNERALRELGVLQRLTSFAFPYGEASPDAKRSLIKRFDVLRGVRPGINRENVDRALLQAVPLEGGEEGIGRAVAFVGDVIRNPGWLILYGHDVRTAPSRWGCTPQQLTDVLNSIGQDVTILPVSSAYQMIRSNEDFMR